MKNFYFVLLFILILSLSAFSSQYGLYSPNEYKIKPQGDEQLLFILDYSNSMTEKSPEGARKVDLMINTMRQILPQISLSIPVGLRVYGNRMGFTPVDACRASSLISPIEINNTESISKVLSNIKPRGMTPITYSLKQALKTDFMGFNGKKHIILLTDGGENCDESPCTFVMNLIKIRRDVKIDVIAYNVNDEDDLAQLQCTALVTSGKFYNAQTAADLLNGFDNSIQGSKNVEAKIILPE